MSKLSQVVKKMTPAERNDLFMELANYADDIAQDQAAKLQLVKASKYKVQIKEELENWGKHRGHHFYIDSIDDMTLGITDGEVLLLSGDSHSGKSQLAFNLAYQQAKQGNIVFFITLEMTKPQAGSRIAKIALQDGLSWDETIEVLDRVVFQKVTKLDYKMIYPITLKAKEEGAAMVFLDHVHYFPRSGEATKTAEVAAISLEIKRAALECKIPIIALCQCRKLDDGRGKRRKPTPLDLKDASELYQDCDICIMVWRDNDGLTADDTQVEVRIWKNRLRGMRQADKLKYFKSHDGAKLEPDDIPTFEEVQEKAKPEDKPRAVPFWADMGKKS